MYPTGLSARFETGLRPGDHSGAAFEQRDESGEAANEEGGFDDAEEVDEPGDADAEGRPMKPPVLRRGHEVDDKEQSHDQRSNEQKLERAPKSNRFCFPSCRRVGQQPGRRHYKGQAGL